MDFWGDIFQGFVQFIVSNTGAWISDILAQNNDFIASVFDSNIAIPLLGFIEAVGGFFFVFGVCFAVSEWAVDVNEGNSNNFMATFKNSLIGFAALCSFTSIPILMLKFTNDICNQLGQALAVESMRDVFSNMNTQTGETAIDSNFFSGWGMGLFEIIAFICVIKVFFGNIKRGGILFTLIIIGSVHMFSIPRGYTDAFWSWCRQVVGVCLTSFCQNLLITLSVVLYGNSSMDPGDMIICSGIMLAASEVPRILQQFGLDTSMRANVTQAIFGISGVMNIASAFR